MTDELDKFCDEMTGLVGKGRAVDIVHPAFRGVFGTDSEAEDQDV